MNDKPTPEDRGWRKEAIGSHWTRGDYTISTYVHAGHYGYEVYKVGHGSIGRVPSFEEAERLADRRNGRVTR